MNIVTGATGNIGIELIKELIVRGEKVTAVSRSIEKAKALFGNAVNIAQADVLDTPTLHKVFEKGENLFILNPPASPASNTDVEERKTALAIFEALKGLRIKRLVLESTMGSQPGAHIGDLGVLYELETLIRNLPYDYRIIRPAYYMSNWKSALQEAKEKGSITSFYPADFKMPMVAPADIAKVASELLINISGAKITSVVGPEDYSPNDVAAAISDILGKKVLVSAIPQDKWVETYRSLGFSKEAASSYSNMTAISMMGNFPIETQVRGSTTLVEYLRSIHN